MTASLITAGLLHHESHSHFEGFKYIFSQRLCCVVGVFIFFPHVLKLCFFRFRLFFLELILCKDKWILVLEGLWKFLFSAVMFAAVFLHFFFGKLCIFPLFHA